MSILAHTMYIFFIYTRTYFIFIYIHPCTEFKISQEIHTATQRFIEYISFLKKENQNQKEQLNTLVRNKSELLAMKYMNEKQIEEQQNEISYIKNQNKNYMNEIFELKQHIKKLETDKKNVEEEQMKLRDLLIKKIIVLDDK